jgi:hypothetical protein
MCIIIVLILGVAAFCWLAWEIKSPAFVKRHKRGYAVLKRGGLAGWYCVSDILSEVHIGNPWMYDNIIYYRSKDKADEVCKLYNEILWSK